MEALKIRDLTAGCLRNIVEMMMTFEWHKAVAKLSEEKERKKAKLLLVKCHEARLILENSELKEISDKLEENKDALINGEKKIEEALKNLDDVKNVLNAVNSLLSVVTRVVTLA